jgi:hypothetical protein
MFPCKPGSQERRLQLAGAPVSITLHACSAGSMTFALAVGDVQEVERVVPALVQLRESAQRNVGGAAQVLALPRVDGMTPQPQTQRLLLEGRLPDGEAVREQVLVFSRGTRVYQASVLGRALDPEAADAFLGSIRLRS